MKGKSILGIVALAGIGLGMYYLLNEHNVAQAEKPAKTEPVQDEKPVAAVDDTKKDTVEEAGLALEKTEAVSSIENRHKEAAKEMKEAVSHILDDSPVTKTENTETLDKLTDDIEKLG